MNYVFVDTSFFDNDHYMLLCFEVINDNPKGCECPRDASIPAGLRENNQKTLKPRIPQTPAEV